MPSIRRTPLIRRCAGPWPSVTRLSRGYLKRSTVSPASDCLAAGRAAPVHREDVFFGVNDVLVGRVGAGRVQPVAQAVDVPEPLTRGGIGLDRGVVPRAEDARDVEISGRVEPQAADPVELLRPILPRLRRRRSRPPHRTCPPSSACPRRRRSRPDRAGSGRPRADGPSESTRQREGFSKSVISGPGLPSLEKDTTLSPPV